MTRAPITLLLAGIFAACDPVGGGMDGGADAGRSEDAGRDAGTDASEPPPSPGEAFDGPSVLSETGLYADLAADTLAEGVMPYDVRFELWSDGSEKRRWLSLPAGTQIDTSDPDRWVFPVGTRAWKEFRAGDVRVETRFLHKVAPDRWENVAYVWRADGSDADARPDGVVDALGTTHDVPALEGCFDCHRGTDGLNGVSAIQLATGEPDALLSRLEAAGRLTDPIDPPSVPGSALEQSTLGYLHANCGHCHNELHPIGAIRALRMRIPLGLSDPLDAPALRTAVGAEMHHQIDGTTIAIVPGDPLASQVYVRMLHRNDFLQMPPRGTEVVDPTGSELVRAWIESLPSTLP